MLCSNGNIMLLASPHGQDTEDGQCSVFPIMPLATSQHTNGKVLLIQARPCSLRFPFLCIAEDARFFDDMKGGSAPVGAITEPLFILSGNRTYDA